MLNRADLRREFDDIANQEKSEVNFAARSAQLVSIQNSLIKGINHLIKFLDGKTTKTEVINQLKGFATTADIERVVNSVIKLDKTTTSAKIDLSPVLVALNALKAEIKDIPSSLPKPEAQRDSVKVSNLKEIAFDTSDLLKAIKSLKLDVKVEPKVNVEKPDLKPLRDVMLDILKAYNKQKEVSFPDKFKISNLGEIKPTDTKNIEKKLDTGNKYLKEISEKKFGGGGGGGESTLAFPLYASITTNVVVSGAITTVTKTDGEKTLTTTIDKTDPADVEITKVWS